MIKMYVQHENIPTSITYHSQRWFLYTSYTYNNVQRAQLVRNDSPRGSTFKASNVGSGYLLTKVGTSILNTKYVLKGHLNHLYKT